MLSGDTEAVSLEHDKQMIAEADAVKHAGAQMRQNSIF